MSKKIILIFILIFSLFIGNNVFAKDDTPVYYNPETGVIDSKSFDGAKEVTMDQANKIMSAAADAKADTTPAVKDSTEPVSGTAGGTEGGTTGDSTSTKTETQDKKGDSTSGGKTSGGKSENIKVLVKERIPGAGCSTTRDKDGNYTCRISPGFGTIQAMIGQIIKWFTAIAALSGVLFIVINGIMLSMHGGEKDKIKGRIVQTITGLILLLLSGVILSIIAPWVYK